MRKLFITVATVILAGCAAVHTAQMVLPPALQGAQQITLTGIGGGRSGSFVAGDFRGEFRRSDERFAFFDSAIERRSGGTSFVVRGPGINGAIEANCRMRERTVTLGIVNFETDPMAYGCRFTHEGQVLPARFEVQARRQGIGGMLRRQERRGEIAFDRVTLGIRSVHDLEGTTLQMASPIGYVFESGGMVVGSVEINGAPVIRFAADTAREVRRAVLLAALALGLFWDPADSALGREAD
jgi:hypothetical protein